MKINPEMNLEVGALYLLKNGHIMRYRGWYGSETLEEASECASTKRHGSLLAFSGPASVVKFPAVGYSASVDYVKKKLDRDDEGWLILRRDMALEKGVYCDVCDCETALAEISGRKTVGKEDLHVMAALNDKAIPKFVEIDGKIKQWIGIGWAEVSETSELDVKKDVFLVIDSTEDVAARKTGSRVNSAG